MVLFLRNIIYSSQIADCICLQKIEMSLKWKPLYIIWHRSAYYCMLMNGFLAIKALGIITLHLNSLTNLNGHKKLPANGQGFCSSKHRSEVRFIPKVMTIH